MGPLILSLFLLCVPAVLCLPTDVQNVPPQCADPSFACQDLESARLCGVAKSCIHDIWSTMSAPDDDEDICQICKEMVKEARDQLLSNMTQEEIKEVFEGSCKLLPIELIADACIKAVDEFIPELVEMLASRMDPNMVCTVSGLCNMAHFQMHGIHNVLLSFAKNNFHHIWDCDYCTSSFSKIKNSVSKIPKDEFKHHIDTFIQFLKPGGYDKAVIYHSIDSLYDFLSSTVKPKAVCAAVKACPVSCEGSNKPKDDLVCEFCTNVLHHIQDLITTNTTVEEFRTALLNFCNVTGKYSNLCTNLVNEYFDTVFNFIRNLDSKSFCTLIDLCGNDACFETPLVKIVPDISNKKVILASKLTPTNMCGKNPCPQIPLIKLVPAAPAKKRIPAVKLMPSSSVNDIDESESANEIFGSSNYQLPAERFFSPSLISKKSLECNFCKGISIYLRKELKATEENIDKTLHNVCNKWASEYLDYCRIFLHKYYLTMRQSILEYGSTEGMCNHIKACLDEENPGGVNVRVIKDNPLCDLCKTTFEEIQNELKDPSVKKSVENTLYQICSYLPQSIQKNCRLFIDNNIDNIFAILEQELTGDNICPAIHLCPGGIKKVIPNNVKDIECDLCKDLVQQLQQKIQEPDMKNSLKDLLDRGCALLPPEITNDCKTFVNENIDTLVNIIANELDPTTICSALNLCQGPSTLSSPPQPPKAAESMKCQLCTNVVERLDNMLKTGATEEEIRKGLDKICSYLPKTAGQKCQHFVDLYTDLLLKMIAENLDPATICTSLKFCSESGISKTQNRKQNDIDCELCKTIIKKVDEELEDRATEDEIRNALDKVCSLLPSKYAQKCQNFINNYVEMLVSILAQEMDPAMVCGALKICPANEEVLQRWKSKAQDLECEGCQYVFHFIQEKLMDSTLQDKIKKVTKEICQHLPKEYAENCNAFIDEYGSSVLVLVAQDLDPSIVCPKLHACTNLTKPAMKKKNNANSNECDMCTTVVNYLDQLLEDDNIDKEITTLIEKVCSLIPSSLHDKCASMIEAYGPYILQMIGEVADSKQVCQEIDMCPRVPGHVHLLGGEKCTFGPTYWCQSKIHASACKAEDYCKKIVWTD